MEPRSQGAMGTAFDIFCGVVTVGIGVTQVIIALNERHKHLATVAAVPVIQDSVSSEETSTDDDTESQE